MSLAPEVIAALIGLGPASVTAMLQGFTTFRRSNVEKYFEKLSRSNEDLTVFGKDETLHRLLFSILEKVSTEANLEKIENWKNATIRLATDFKDFDYKDNFIRTLDYLTAFDLTVLFEIYSSEFIKVSIEEELTNRLKSKDVPEEMTMQSLKTLASHNLIIEQFDQVGVYGDDVGNPALHGMYYTKNKLGLSFLKFVTDKTIILSS